MPNLNQDQRTRVSVRFDCARGVLGAGTSIRIAVERRWDADKHALKFSKSLKKSGGRSGLDAAFVTRAIQSKCFAETSAAQEQIFQSRADYWTLLLPGNVRVSSSGAETLTVEADGLSVDRSFDGTKAVIAKATRGVAGG